MLPAQGSGLRTFAQEPWHPDLTAHQRPLGSFKDTAARVLPLEIVMELAWGIAWMVGCF